MMIEDEELRSLYQTTCSGRLQTLASGLLDSQVAPNAALLETLRREAHSLKGDSSVMGLEDITMLAQQVEITLKALQQQSIDWQAPLIDSLGQTLRAIEQLVQSVTTDVPAEVDAQQVGDSLRAILTSPPPVIPNDKEMMAPPSSFSPPSSFIADAGIRVLYRTTSEGRLQAMTHALEQLSTKPQDKIALAEFLNAAQGLKGDSLEVEQSAVALVSQQLEAIANNLITHTSGLTSSLKNHLWQGLQLIEQLVHEAVTDTHIHLAPQQLNQCIAELAAQATDLLSDVQTSNAPLVAAELFEDAELREVYKTTSEERFQQLESELLQLEKEPGNQEILAAIAQAIHSIKGDAQAIQVAPIESVAQTFEVIVDSIQRQEIVLTPALLTGFRDSLMTMGALVQTATMGTPSNINVTQVTENLLVLAEQSAVTAAPYASERSLAAPPAAPVAALTQISPVTQIAPATTNTNPPPDIQLEAQTDAQLNQGIRDNTAMPVAVSSIEDAELREVYSVVSAERLQRLELGLVQLESQPDDPKMLAELLREAHSLKGDARSVGLNNVEGLAHAIEDILMGIQHQTISLSSELGDLLYRGLDAIAQLIDAAITGIPHPLAQTEQLLHQLRDRVTPATEASVLPDLSAIAAPSVTTPPSTQPSSTHEFAPLPDTPPATHPLPVGLNAANKPYRIQTIRVQTRDLDTLALQTEQLTLTRIQIAQTTAQMAELAALWGKWRAHQNSQQPSHRPDFLDPEQPATNPYEGQLDALINKLRLITQENSFKLDLISQDLGQQVQTLRLLPIDNVLKIFPRVVRDLARQQAKSVELITEGGETTADKRILEEIQDSLMHLVRNAVDHGIETSEDRVAADKSPTAKLWIRSKQTPNSLVIEVADDGRGLNLEKIKQTAIKRKLYTADELSGLSPKQIQDLIFVPGFSTRRFTTEISGRGVGLDVVRNQIERLRGNIQIESTPGQGSTFRLQIRTQLTTANVVLIHVRGVTHALPIEFLHTTMRISLDDIVTVDGRDTIRWHERTLPIRELFDVLELAHSPAYHPPVEPVLEHQRACILLKVGDEMGAFLVDRLLDTQEVVFKPQSALLKRIRNVTGATILANGEVCTILNPPDLIKSIQRNHTVIAPIVRVAPRQRKSLILLVEDSPPVRIQEKRLFENAGYEVVVAENGREGYNLLRQGRFDAIVSDIEMPHLDLSLRHK